MDKLDQILEFIKEKKIICPNPRTWNHLWTNIFDGFNETWKDDKEIDKYLPLILNGWGPSSDEDKHERFINSIEYFYNKYPEKRQSIEDFILKNDHWFMGWD